MDHSYHLGRSNWRTYEEGIEKEWLITNGLGGYANQSIIGANHRSQCGYLNVTLNPPANRYTVFSKTHEMVAIQDREYDLSSQKYINETKNGQQYLNHFEYDAIPTYTYQVEDFIMKKTVVMEHGHNTSYVAYDVHGGKQGGFLTIVPMFNMKELGFVVDKSRLQFTNELDGQRLKLTAHHMKQLPIYVQISKGEFYDRHLKPVSMATPDYIYETSQVYNIDVRNGLNYVDYHYTPYEIHVKIKPGEHTQFWIGCSVEDYPVRSAFDIMEEARSRRENLIAQAEWKDCLARKLVWASDCFITKRNSTGLITILAGYPWFLDWGRDTMIAFTGLTLSTKRFDDARDILLSFVQYMKDGLLPNVFPNNDNEKPRYNTFDASLWYFYAVYEYLQYTNDYAFVEAHIYESLHEIIEAYRTGTEFGIHMDDDYLVQGGSNLDQITWMDVRVGDLVVTPRHGKPVEINALWYNALRVMEHISEKISKPFMEYHKLADLVKESFHQKFWNESEDCLYDVIEIDAAGREIKDASIRPNQIWAVSLPFSILPEDKEKKIVDVVYEQLYTPYGIRSLSFQDPRYQDSYIGKLINRDKAYHMGTAWGYIMGGFISAYCKVNHHSDEAIERALNMCRSMEDHMMDGCLNGIAEIFDGDNACTSRGCYTQAWSVGELLRAYEQDVLPYMYNK